MQVAAFFPKNFLESLNAAKFLGSKDLGYWADVMNFAIEVMACFCFSENQLIIKIELPAELEKVAICSKDVVVVAINWSAWKW